MLRVVTIGKNATVYFRVKRYNTMIENWSKTSDLGYVSDGDSGFSYFARSSAT